jgi:hypothetical protein
MFNSLLRQDENLKNIQKKLNIFQFNVKLFNISGVIPSENIKSSLWKSALYHIYQALSLLLHLFMIILQFIAIHHYWGNVNVVAEIICNLSGSVALCVFGFYTKIFWKKFCDVTDIFETNSIFCSELVRSNPKHMKIVNETFHRAQTYNKVISMSLNLEPIFFILPTLFQHIMASEEEMLQAAETMDGFTKLFSFVIWLPPVAKQVFIIRVMYGLQCITLWEIGLFTAAIATFYAVLFLFTGAQFKLISSIIREMEEVIYLVENPGNELCEISEQIFPGERKTLSCTFQSPLPLESEEDEDGPTNVSTQRKRSKIKPNILQEDGINRQSERIYNLSSPEIKSARKNYPESFYLLECIKLHQASIK